MTLKIPKRIARTLISSLKGGVVPRIGLPYITVGRKNEIDALLHDVDVIADGGASFRFIVGRYGSGKSFLLQTLRNYVMEKDFVVVDADLSPERRLQGTKGQGLATYRELVRNMATKTRPEGGALPLILDRWINQIQQQVVTETGLALTDGRLDALVEQGGRNLSGGQKQRLTIARALVKKPDILIMDDSASALDFATDLHLRQAIKALEGEMTVFIVSQRTSSVRQADLILVLDDGKLVGQGTHLQLLETCPVYQEIFDSQYPGRRAEEIRQGKEEA